MGVDLTVNLPCSVKQHFGAGECSRGTLVITDLLKARNRAELVQSQYTDQATQPIVRIVRLGPDGPREETTTVEALLTEAARLDDQARPCQGCPGNMLGRPYGCFMYVRYPISASAEHWLMDNLQVYGQPGGALFLKAFDELGFDGAPIADWRAQGLFESKTPIAKVVRRQLLRSTKINSNQVFHLLFAAGPSLSREHCLMALSLLGAIDLSDPECARLHIGEKSDDPGIVDMKILLQALFGAFINAVDLLVDA